LDVKILGSANPSPSHSSTGRPESTSPPHSKLYSPRPSTGRPADSTKLVLFDGINNNVPLGSVYLMTSETLSDLRSKIDQEQDIPGEYLFTCRSTTIEKRIEGYKIIENCLVKINGNEGIVLDIQVQSTSSPPVPKLIIYIDGDSNPKGFLKNISRTISLDQLRKNITNVITDIPSFQFKDNTDIPVSSKQEEKMQLEECLVDGKFIKLKKIVYFTLKHQSVQ